MTYQNLGQNTSTDILAVQNLQHAVDILSQQPGIHTGYAATTASYTDSRYTFYNEYVTQRLDKIEKMLEELLAEKIALKKLKS